LERIGAPLAKPARKQASRNFAENGKAKTRPCWMIETRYDAFTGCWKKGKSKAVVKQKKARSKALLKRCRVYPLPVGDRGPPPIGVTVATPSRELPPKT
jgi:hypothetical protein